MKQAHADNKAIRAHVNKNGNLTYKLVEMDEFKKLAFNASQNGENDLAAEAIAADKQKLQTDRKTMHEARQNMKKERQDFREARAQEHQERGAATRTLYGRPDVRERGARRTA